MAEDKNYKQFHPADFSGMAFHPELEELMDIQEKPSLLGELKILEDAKSTLLKTGTNGGIVGVDNDLRTFGSAHWKNFDKFQRLGAETYLKNLSLYQDNPQDTHLRDVTLATALSFRHLPLDSLFSDENGLHSMAIPPAYRKEGIGDKEGTLSFLPDRVPRYDVDSKGSPYLNYQKLDSTNTLYFPNTGALGKASYSFMHNLHDLHNLDVTSLIDRYNDLLDKGEERLDRQMVPDVPAFPLVAEVRKEGKGSEGLALIIDIVNLTLKARELPSLKGDELPPEGSEEEMQAFQDMQALLPRNPLETDVGDYWKKIDSSAFPHGIKGPDAGIERYQVKTWLKNAIYRKLFSEGKLDEESKESIAQLVGAAARFYPEHNGIPTNIKVDKSGKAILEGNNPLSYVASEAVFEFMNDQIIQLQNREPELWSNNANHETAMNQGRDDLVETIQTTMQEMMKNRAKGSGSFLPFDWDPFGKGPTRKGVIGNVKGQDPWPKPTSPGMEVPEEHLSMGGVVSPELIHLVSEFGDGLGMQGASQQEMKHLISVVAQYLQLQNQAAMQGDPTPSYEDRSKDWYQAESGKFHMYDTRKRTGPMGVQKQMWKEQDQGEGGRDPIYHLVTDFIKNAENYVIIAGRNGERIIPVIEYLGLETRRLQTSGDSLSSVLELPLRINNVHLRGTDIGSQRELVEEITKDFKVLGKNFKSIHIKGDSIIGRSDLAFSDPSDTTVKESLDAGATDLLAYEKNPQLDTNKDGKVDAAERTKAAEMEVIPGTETRAGLRKPRGNK